MWGLKKIKITTLCPYIYIYIYIYVYIIYIYIYIPIWRLFCFMQIVVCSICDVHLLILWQVIMIFDFGQILHNNNESIRYYGSCFKQEKNYRNYIVLFMNVFKYVCFFFFIWIKYALKNISIHVMYIFTKSITIHKGKEWNICFFKIIN